MYGKAALEKSQNGFSLIELLVIVAIMSIMTLGMLGVFESQKREQKYMELKASIQDLQTGILVKIGRQEAWMKSIANNASMTCLAGANCTDISGGAFDLYDAAGIPAVMTSTPTAGFNRSGVACNTFSHTEPISGCFIRIELEWKAQCDVLKPANHCGSPEELVSLKLILSSAALNSGIIINSKNYSVENKVRRGMANDLPDKRCASRAGIFVGDAPFRSYSPDGGGCVPYAALL